MSAIKRLNFRAVFEVNKWPDRIKKTECESLINNRERTRKAYLRTIFNNKTDFAIIIHLIH